MVERAEASSRASRTSASWSARLAATANVAVIGLCLLVAWLVVKRVGVGPAASSGAEIYEIGESIGPLHGVDFAAAPTTLLMVLREDCHFCQESLPFYKQLSEARLARGGSNLRVVVASTDQPDTLNAYLQSEGVRVDQVLNVAPGALKVPGTPCLLLVDRAGKVAAVWRGRLAERQQVDVLKRLGLRSSN